MSDHTEHLEYDLHDQDQVTRGYLRKTANALLGALTDNMQSLLSEQSTTIDAAWLHDFTARLERIETAITTEGVQMTTLGASVDDLAAAVTALHARFDEETTALTAALADAQSAKDALAVAIANDAADAATIAQKQADLDTANAAAVDAAARIEALVAELAALGQPVVTPPAVVPPQAVYALTDPTATVDPAVWTVAPFTTSDGNSLYYFVSDVAPSDGSTPVATSTDPSWTQYTGSVIEAPVV